MIAWVRSNVVIRSCNAVREVWICCSVYGRLRGATAKVEADPGRGYWTLCPIPIPAYGLAPSNSGVAAKSR